MWAFVSTLLILFEGSTHGAESGFRGFYNEYFNISGFELWKFLNLGIFVAIMFYLLRKPLGEAFKAKRELIRAELIKAEEEKKAALAKLAIVEGKLAQLETEKQNILVRAKAEGEASVKRMADASEQEAARLRKQAESDLARIEAQKSVELRRFSAEESIRIAEEKLRARIDVVIDSRLINANIQEIGGLN
ncbi:MAG: hypothetical protein ABJA02_07810 [Acidobacteriota bacterium]